MVRSSSLRLHARAPGFHPPNLLVHRVHLGAPTLRQAASSESPSSAGPYAVVRKPLIAGPNKRNTRAQRRFPTQWSRNCGESGKYLCAEPVWVPSTQTPISGPTRRSQQRAGSSALLRACCAVSSVGSAGRYLLDWRVLSIHSLHTSPPIKPPRLRRSSHGPGLGHHCIFGGDTATAGPASPPLGAPLGPSAGSPIGAQPEARRAADRCTLPVLPVLLRRRALGWVGEEEF
ncbi:hypothetical protein NDU88_003692 [Pleurodeles waltl]|uniref:Uncharacterized protein n=1 Tax=Pleurodeles waltl TaxID=8319 RepID=A0AAV7NQE4_PLEWA|nr:hypothetical protein NDU88_003692 [Pleurodeles waltl]